MRGTLAAFLICVTISSVVLASGFIPIRSNALVYRTIQEFEDRWIGSASLEGSEILVVAIFNAPHDDGWICLEQSNRWVGWKEIHCKQE